MSPRHSRRYFNEFSGRHRLRTVGTLGQIELTIIGTVGKRLRYKDPEKANGPDSGAREMAA
ncbi:MAG: hypothetical protein F4Y47_07490 [Acidobacteriia bacterium]|nr:hypothetical protein [Terriglobia bacterium]MYG04458.1 hypothetical protein [Terriglobia bacterium]MYK11131.1 hypothetical protein [Terriglobia bacterium]